MRELNPQDSDHLARFDFSKKVKRKADFVLQNVGGENLLVPIGAQVMDLNGLITLNAAGRCLWELLAEECSVDDLAAALTDKFEVDLDRAHQDVETFLEEITRIGLLESE